MGKMEVDSQLWHACAGAMVKMPGTGSKVYYFPQGHAEHAATPPELNNVAPLVLCTVVGVSYLADADTDEVYVRIRLQPTQEEEENENEEDGCPLGEKPASFAKTLTQSDANNGGGFSVPRYCAETIFPRLDYSNEPPVQTVLARDVHGELWKFRHIYRGTPRRHLLTTGWSSFVNQKKLVAGDSIVFLRKGASGDLCVGVRRSARNSTAASPSPPDWHWPAVYRSASACRWGGCASENLADFSNSASGGGGFARNRGRVCAKSVVEAATSAAAGQAFEVIYYPRASTPEFCVKAQAVRAAMKSQWVPGTRFKMAFETEDSARISWFVGTIASVQFADPVHWPNSPWRLLQVTWDEPDLLQNVKRVSPWLVEVVSSMPTIQMTPFMLPKKKLRVTQPPEFHLESRGGIMGLQVATLTNNVLGPINSWHGISNNVPAGMQGARHDSIYGIGFPDIRQNKFQSRLLLDNLQHQEQRALPPCVSTELNIGSFSLERCQTQNNLSSSLTMGNSSQSDEKNSRYTGSSTVKSTPFLLFGKAIHTEQIPKSPKQQQSGISSSDGPGFQTFNDICSPGFTSKSSSDDNQEMERIQTLINEKTDGPKISDKCSLRSQQGQSFGDTGTNVIGTFQKFKDQTAILSLKKNIGGKMSEDTIVHCKVFSDTEEVGRTLDLTLFKTYDQLYDSLAKMFGIEGFKLSNRVLYKDIGNTLRHAGEEPYGDFMKTVRRLTIVSESGRVNM